MKGNHGDDPARTRRPGATLGHLGQAEKPSNANHFPDHFQADFQADFQDADFQTPAHHDASMPPPL
jgi:hypothetical protein